jgi:hypothetical protein
MRAVRYATYLARSVPTARKFAMNYFYRHLTPMGLVLALINIEHRMSNDEVLRRSTFDI